MPVLLAWHIKNEEPFIPMKSLFQRTCTVLPLCFAALAASYASGQSGDMTGTIASITPEIIALRHRIHQYPELGNREFKTAALVAEHLQALGMDVRTGIAHTGVVGILKGGRPGPVVAVRADMDALPVAEATGFSFSSKETALFNGEEVGVMHACGHDIHTSIMLGVASTLAAHRESLSGTVIFVFQPAEEGPPEGEDGGARMMLAENVFGDLKPEAIYALHTNTDLETGQIGYVRGTTAASSDIFTAKMIGRQAHAAFPELGVDPVVMGSQAVLALQTIPSRNMSVFEPTVISVTQFNGGIRYNIIPDAVTLKGGVRVFTETARDEVERRMKEVLDNIAESAGGHSEFTYERRYPPLLNDDILLEEGVPVLQAALGADKVLEVSPVMAAEDFAYYTHEVPGFFLFLGVVKPGTESGPNHSPTFRADDDSIPVGIRAITALVTNRLAPGGMN